MEQTIQAIRGMSDVLPEESPLWQRIEHELKKIMKQYHYQEIRFPIVEKTALFARSIGEVTDIVEKEMYVFTDRNDESLALRPEGTASCVRACIEHGLLYNQTQKLWYMGPMFRYERPQKGRYRQFHHFGVEAFGFNDPQIEAELLALTYRLWRKLGLEDKIRLEINSLGTVATRKAYREKLVAYYQQHEEKLDEDSKRRLGTNPLRILDSKNPDMIALNQDAPKLIDYLDEESTLHFKLLCQFLETLRIPFTVNTKLVRGLDYYSKTVFEWVTDELGAQGTVCAGGRYDGLVEQLGGHPTSAVGFAIGLERLVLLLKEQVVTCPGVNFYGISLGNESRLKLFDIIEKLRDELPEAIFYQVMNESSLKNQLKRADKLGAEFALILGEQELAAQQVILKNLKTFEEHRLPIAQAVEAIKNIARSIK